MHPPLTSRPIMPLVLITHRGARSAFRSTAGRARIVRRAPCRRSTVLAVKPDRCKSSTLFANTSQPRTRAGEANQEMQMAKYGQSAAKRVKSAMGRKKKGTLKSGSGRKVTSRKQAIAIGLNEAREKGAKVPARKTARKKAARKGARKTARKTAGAGGRQTGARERSGAKGRATA